MEVNAKIDQYVQLLDQINNRVGDEAIAGRIMQEIAQDQRARVTTEPATKRQVEWLTDLGATIPAGRTKPAASAMLAELTGQT